MKNRNGLNIGFDAKRAFHNSSGLGNYSRDYISLIQHYEPNNNYFLFSPGNHKFNVNLNSNSKVINPKGLYNNFGSLWRTFGMTADIRNNTIDLYHGLSQELPFGINKLNIKSVVTIHDCIFLRFPQLFDPLYRVIFKKKYAYAIKNADRIIAISEQTKNDIIHFFKADEAKIDVVYQGCNPIFYTAASDLDKTKVLQKYKLPNKFMLYVGTIEERKNLLSIFKGLKHAKTDLPVVVIGRPTKYLDEVKGYLEKNNLTKRALFLHNVETVDLPSIYQLSKVFIYPSQFEGFGIPILEALNSGTPVITTNGSCFPEVGGDAVKYVNFKDDAAMQEAIDEVLINNTLREEMVTKGRTQALKFREEHIANNISRVYNKVFQ